MELESVHNNAKLLSEMLDSYNQDETSAEDLELMKELHQACERLKPILLRLASETQGNVEMLGTLSRFVFDLLVDFSQLLSRRI